MADNTIKVMVSTPQQPEEIQSKQALPHLGNYLREQIATQVIDVNIELLQERIKSTVSKLLIIADTLPDSEKYEATQISLALSIDAQGEISIAGYISGGGSTNSGIVIQLSKKKAVPEQS